MCGVFSLDYIVEQNKVKFTKRRKNVPGLTDVQLLQEPNASITVTEQIFSVLLRTVMQQL